MSEINYEWDTTVTQVYQDVVGAADPKSGTSRKEAFDLAAERLAEMVATGELFIDVDRAIRSALGRADDEQGRSADRAIQRLVDGQQSIDVDDDPMLDIVVKLGGGKRKLWRHVDAADLREMDRLRYQNYRDQANAYDQWRHQYEQALVAVIKHGTVGAADEAGAFEGEVHAA